MQENTCRITSNTEVLTRSAKEENGDTTPNSPNINYTKCVEAVRRILMSMLKQKVLNIVLYLAAASGQSDLTAKLNQMQELVRQKNKVEVKLSQQLQDTKKELEKERESFRAEINERETRERALEVGKRQLEAQLTVVDSENYESLQELALLQERLEERIRVESELREEKNKLLYVIKEKDNELAKERSELSNRLQQHEQVIEVRI